MDLARRAAGEAPAPRRREYPDRADDRPTRSVLARAGPELTRLGYIQALEQVENWTDNFIGTPISFSTEDHQGLNSIHLSKAEGGQLVDLSGWLES